MPFEGGVAYYNDDAPLLWDLNFVRFDGPARDPAGIVERLGDAQAHRAALVEDPALVEAIAPELEAAGMRRRDLVVQARAPDGRLDPDVREPGFAELERFRIELSLEQTNTDSLAVARQAARIHGRREQRWMVIEADGEAAGQLLVYSEDGLAQLESVGVLRHFHRRGLARRLIEHALAALAPDHDTVFIVAEADDWPKDFYRRLGFERVEQRADFLLLKASGTASASS